MDRKEFGQRVRSARKNLGMDKDAFSEKIELSAGFLNEIECGAKGASIETIEKICELAGVSADYLIFGKENFPNTKTPIIEALERIPYKYNPIILNSLHNIESLINMTKADNTEEKEIL
jgi:transcriptional regulator with XRE-family HTH domain